MNFSEGGKPFLRNSLRWSLLISQGFVHKSTKSSYQPIRFCGNLAVAFLTLKERGLEIFLAAEVFTRAEAFLGAELFFALFLGAAFLAAVFLAAVFLAGFAFTLLVAFFAVDFWAFLAGFAFVAAFDFVAFGALAEEAVEDFFPVFLAALAAFLALSKRPFLSETIDSLRNFLAVFSSLTVPVRTL